MLALGHSSAPVLAVVGVLLAMSAAAAQAPRTSIDIQAQVHKSAELQQQALQSLADVERAERLISNAYATLQAAMSGMVIAASGRKTVDPLFTLNEQRMRQALFHLQQASDLLKTNRTVATGPQGQEKDEHPPETPAVASQSHLGDVQNNLQKALRLTNGVLIL